jgi:hypothetical protein
MKKAIILFVILLLCMAGQQLMSNSTGAIRATGSQHPGGCVMCHAGVPANSDPVGSVTINIPGASESYVPGKTYEITVTTTYNTFNKFGYACDVVDNIGQVAGVLSAAGNDEMQLLEQDSYITHTLKGTAGFDHQKTWKFNWTAPDAARGAITIYVGSVAADDNKGLGGDRVYTASHMLRPQAVTTAAQEIIVARSLDIFPVPATSYIDLNFELNKKEDVQVKMYDLNGREVEHVLFNTTGKGMNTVRLLFSHEYEPGIYVASIRAGESAIIRKLIIR